MHITCSVCHISELLDVQHSPDNAVPRSYFQSLFFHPAYPGSPGRYGSEQPRSESSWVTFLSTLIKLKAVFLSGLHKQLAKGQCSGFGHFYLYEVLGRNVSAQWTGQELKAEHNTEVWWDGQVWIWIPKTHGVHLLCSQMGDSSSCWSIQACFDLSNHLTRADWSSACPAELDTGYVSTLLFVWADVLAAAGLPWACPHCNDTFVSSIHKLPLWSHGWFHQSLNTERCFRTVCVHI